MSEDTKPDDLSGEKQQSGGLKLGPFINGLAKSLGITVDLSGVLRPMFIGLQELAGNLVDYSTRILVAHENILAEHHISLKEAGDILQRYHWWLSPSMPISFLRDVIALGSRPGNQRSAMNKIFASYLSNNNYENLWNMFNDWSSDPYFANRIKILKDCINTLSLARNNKNINITNVLLPTLIAQIDGILIQYRKTHGISEKDWRKKLAQHFKNLRASDTDITLIIENSLIDHGNAILLNRLFQSTKNGIPPKTARSFTRNKIMHGEATNYGKIENVYRAFLLLDYLHHLEDK